MPTGHLPPGHANVPADFFGVCVATQPNPAADDYVIDALRALGLRSARLDYTYSSEESFTQRFLDRLLAEGFSVCLHLVQPFHEARDMPGDTEQEAWRSFVVRTLDRYGQAVEMVEIGTTCNRRRWSGYTATTFLHAWSVAHEEVTRRGITLAGPNVTDFEPVYNVGWLGLMKEHGLLPDLHSDNLFAERATEPEAFDTKILGRALAPFLKMNLIKKARLLARISDRNGLPPPICPHVAWSLRRIDRILVDTEEKQADYVARYCCLAAAAGALGKLYWGPLISQREGLIDDGTDEYPAIPHVTLYAKANGKVSGYRKRPAFHAYGTTIQCLSGARFEGSPVSGRGLEIHVFTTADHDVVHVVWTTNGHAAPVKEVYTPQDLAAATPYGRDGGERPAAPTMFTESPVYLVWHDGLVRAPLTTASIRKKLRIYNAPDRNYEVVDTDRWQGIQVLSPDSGPDRDRLLPERLEHDPAKSVLRDKRHCVWSVPRPSCPDRLLVVKRLQTQRLHKKVIQTFRRPRALTNWNSAQELLRRGIPTPTPVAFFLPKGGAPTADNYFVYEMFPATGSVRDAFTAFSEGATDFQGMAADALYDHLAGFLANMHGRGVFFRDLSAGNILLDLPPGREVPGMCLIDTARARFANHAISLSQRLSDLSRIMHPLDWKARHAFLAAYLNKAGMANRPWYKLPFALYDLKHVIKRVLKGKRWRQPRPGPQRERAHRQG